MVYFAQHFKAIRQLRNKLWASEISQDFSLRYVSDGYHVLHSPSELLHRHLGNCTIDNKATLKDMGKLITLIHMYQQLDSFAEIHVMRNPDF